MSSVFTRRILFLAFCFMKKYSHRPAMNIHGIRIRTTLIIVSALALAACSESGHDENTPQADMAPLRFEVNSRGSRAEISTATMSSFTVWGSMRTTGSTDAWSPVFGTASTTVSHNATDGWTYPGEQRYWQQGYSYTFVAFVAAYDNDGAPRVVPVYNTAVDGNGHYLSFSDFDGTHATDIVYAVEARDVTDSPTTTSTVNLAFQHLTSHLEIVGRVDPLLGENHTITVLSAKLYGMNTKGSWSGASFNPATANLGMWTSLTLATVDAPYASRPDGNNLVLKSADTEPSDLFATTVADGTTVGGVLMIPQEIPVDARMMITYRNQEGRVRSLTLNLYEASLAIGAEWRAGMNYRYTVNFGATDYIFFDKPVVEPWTYQVGGNIIVQ